jgi:hypothetical protein
LECFALLVYLIVAVVALAIIAGVFFLMRGAAGTAPGDPARTTAAAPSGFEFHPPATDFHVAGGAAHVYIGVPLPAGDPDPVLTEILLREAVEVLRAKRRELPLSGVSTVHAHALRNGDKVEVGKLSLDGPGELPPPADPADLPWSMKPGRDLFDDLGGEEGARPEVAFRAPGDELAPLAGELRLTGLMEAGLRAQGIDPQTASFQDLVAGLLRLAGYLPSGEIGTTMTATRNGVLHYLEIVDHEPGSHPELSERAVAGFMGRFSQSGATRGLLFTPKYAPFEIYGRERRQPRVRFVTRERFQTFVDSLSFG